MDPHEQMWSELYSSTVRTRVVSFAWTGSASTGTSTTSEDITLVTHASIHKLSRLLDQIQIWGGPVSAAIYLQSMSTVQATILFLNDHRERLSRTNIHILLEPNETMVYPINTLRNIAMNYAETDYILAIDVDFVTDAGCYQSLHQAISHNSKLRTTLRARTLWVLPAFERFLPSELGRKDEVDSLSLKDIPQTKDQLLTMIKQKLAAPFHQHFQPGHGATNYAKWYTSEDMYHITYQARFEPYVLAYRHGLAQYWEGFRGFGFNKGSWVMQMHFQGYSFAVLPRHFVIHINHPGGGDGRFPNGEIIAEWHNFKKYLQETYNVRREQLVDYFGFGDG